MGETCKHIKDADFDAEVLKSTGLVIVDFWAEWCGPCRQLGPVLEELAGQMADKVKIVKMNVDESPATPGSYGIRSIPTLIMFKNGQLVEAKVGALPRQAIINWINEKAA